jgi:hypothetical protein
MAHVHKAAGKIRIKTVFTVCCRSIGFWCCVDLKVDADLGRNMLSLSLRAEVTRQEVDSTIT